MKKLIAMLIALSCVFCTVSCDNNGGTKPPSIPTSDGGASFSEFVKAASEMNAVKTASIETTLENATKGELVSLLNITYQDDGSSVVEYSIDRYGDLSANEEFIETDIGRVECDANGNYVGANDTVGNVIANGAFALNLDEYKLNDAKIEGNMLYAKVFSDDTAAVLGVNIKATVSIIVVIADGKITALSAEYEKDGNRVNVKCQYGFDS